MDLINLKTEYKEAEDFRGNEEGFDMFEPELNKPKFKKNRRKRKIVNIVIIIVIFTFLGLQFLSRNISELDPENIDKISTRFGSLTNPTDNNSYGIEAGNKLLTFSTIPSIDRPNNRQETATEPGRKISLTPKETDSGNIIDHLPKTPEKTKKIGDLPSPEELPSMRPEPVPENIREDLPKNIKEAAKIALGNWPEGKDEIELEKLRTATSKYIIRKDGFMRQEIGAGPLHFEAGDGTWQDISMEIKPVAGFNISGLDTFKYANETNNFKTYFKESSKNNDYLDLTFRGKDISFSFPEHTELGEIQQNTAQVEGNKITYPEIYPGIDLRYTMGYGGVLEEYIVKSPEALENLTHVTQKFESNGTSFTESDDGFVQFRNNETGEKVWHFPRPVIYELNDQSQRNYGLTRDITKDGDYYISQKILATETFDWLNDPKRTYPIVIDDTTNVDYTDTNYLDGHIIYDGSTYSKSEDSDPIKVGGDKQPNPDESYRGYIKFDITDLTEASYQQVVLYLRMTVAAGSGDRLEIKAVPNDPTGRTAQELWGDINTATSYVAFIWAEFADVDIDEELGSTALTDLNNALSNDWFGVSLVLDDEANDDLGIMSEEGATTAYMPRLGALFDLIYLNDTSAAIIGSRITFFDQGAGYYWAIFETDINTNIYGWYSSDGESWTTDTSDYFSGSHPGAYYDEANDRVIACADSDLDIEVNVGDVGTTAIDWAASNTLVMDGSDLSDHYSTCRVGMDADGYCWVSAQHDDSDTHYIKAVKSTNTDCTTWGTPVNVSTGSGNTQDRHSEVVPVSSDGDVMVMWTDNSTFRARRWDDSETTWFAVDDISATDSYYSGFAVHDDNYDLHFIYSDDGGDVTYQKYDESTDTYGSALEILTGEEVMPTASLDTATNTIYASWISPGAADYDHKIQYKSCDLDTDCTNISNWDPDTAGTAYSLPNMYYCLRFSASYRVSGRVWVIGEEGYFGAAVQHLLEIPESFWFLIPVIAFLPEQVQKKLKGRSSSSSSARSARCKKKKGRFSRLFSVFGFKKKK